MVSLKLMLQYFLVVISTKLVFGEVYYVAEFADKIKSCKDFDNKLIDPSGLELTRITDSETDETYLGLSGCLEMKETIGEGLEIILTVNKYTEVGEEPMINAMMDLCKAISDDSTPWYNAMVALNITKCPIPENKYNVEGITLSLECFDGYMTNEFVGMYVAKLIMRQGAEEKACHMMRVTVEERKRD